MHVSALQGNGHCLDSLGFESQDEMTGIQTKVWEMMTTLSSTGDSIVQMTLRGIRECVMKMMAMQCLEESKRAKSILIYKHRLQTFTLSVLYSNQEGITVRTLALECTSRSDGKNRHSYWEIVHGNREETRGPSFSFWMWHWYQRQIPRQEFLHKQQKTERTYSSKWIDGHDRTRRHGGETIGWKKWQERPIASDTRNEFLSQTDKEMMTKNILTQEQLDERTKELEWLTRWQKTGHSVFLSLTMKWKRISRQNKKTNPFGFTRKFENSVHSHEQFVELSFFALLRIEKRRIVGQNVWAVDQSTSKERWGNVTTKLTRVYVWAKVCTVDFFLSFLPSF